MAGTKGRSGGHNRKTVAALKLAGAYRPGRHAGRVDPPAESAPIVKPTRLSSRASRLWDELAPVVPPGVLTPSDVMAFSTLVELLATAEWISGLKTSDPNRFDPKLEREFAAAVRPWLALFYLDPVSRARLPVPSKAAANPLDRFLNRPPSKWAGELK